MSVKAVLSLLVEALSRPLPVLRDMWCPLCHIELAVSRRFGNAIDYCPLCRGVWLDNAGFDRIIEESRYVEYRKTGWLAKMSDSQGNQVAFDTSGGPGGRLKPQGGKHPALSGIDR